MTSRDSVCVCVYVYMCVCVYMFYFFQQWADHRHKVQHVETTNVQALKNSHKPACLYTYCWDISNCCNAVTTWLLARFFAGCHLLHIMDFKTQKPVFKSLTLNPQSHLKTFYRVFWARQERKFEQEIMFTKISLQQKRKRPINLMNVVSVYNMGEKTDCGDKRTSYE